MFEVDSKSQILREREGGKKEPNSSGTHFLYSILPSSFQKSPAKKLTNALSKSLSCASSREPLHPMFPDQPEKPLNLAHIV